MQQKILFITPAFNKGGAENQLFKVASHLKSIGYAVEILSFINTNDFAGKLAALDIKFTSLNIQGIKSKLALLPCVISYIRNSKPDLVISFMFAANVVARMAKLLTKVPLITSVRNNEISKLYHWLYKVTYKLDDATVFNSEYALKKFKNLKITHPDRSVLINNAIEVTGTLATGSNNDCFRWVSVAHFRPQKDYKTLFSAVNILKAKGVKFELIVLGHTFGQQWPAEMIAGYQIGDFVYIRGFESDVSGLLKAADGLVHSSLWEGTPNAILEAMSYALPVVASRIPGVVELVETAQCGFLFNVTNAEDLADKMSLLMQTRKEERKTMGNNGRKHIELFYEKDNILAQWGKTVTKILAK